MRIARAQAEAIWSDGRTKAGAKAPEIAEAMTLTVDKAQKVIDSYLARRGVLAANAIRKLEDYRSKVASSRDLSSFQES